MGARTGIRNRRCAWPGALITRLVWFLVFAAFAVPAAAQEHVVHLLGGVAATGTSADQSTLGVAQLEADTPRFFIHDGWNLRGVGDAGWQPLFTMRGTTPEYREGLSVAGGFRLAHTTARLETALVGRVGTTHV